MNTKKAALVGCSDPLPVAWQTDIARLAAILQAEGLQTQISPLLFEGQLPSPRQKAEALNRLFADPAVEYIFDVSGGDLANTVLPYLDWKTVAASRATLFGYSDLTAVLNAVTAKTGRHTVNYQLRNLLYADAPAQLAYFRSSVLPRRFAAADLAPRFLRGSGMRGRVFGGNLRCFLKLAGTPYWPDLTNGILLLESYGGGPYQMITALEQYRQMGVFDRIAGILLGTFTAMEEENGRPAIEEIVLHSAPQRIPVACTRLIGHYPNARAIPLGSEMIFE